MKALAIDDDPIFRFLITELLGKCGIKDVDTFEDGDTAYQHLKSLEKRALPQLILLDLNMPVMDGWDLLDLMAAENLLQDIDIWVLSSSDYPEDLQRTKDYDVIKKVITKPISLQTLKTEMANYLEQKAPPHE